MRDHIRRMIDAPGSVEGGSPPGGDGHDHPTVRIAAEAIRLARLAASTHMVLAVRLQDDAELQRPQPAATAEGVRR